MDERLDRTTPGLSLRQRTLKRGLDLIVAAAALVLLGWLIPPATWIIRSDGGGPGLFRQVRIGRHGQRFDVIKLRTMRPGAPGETTVTTSQDARITPFGRLLRRTKLDELPQLLNVLRGDMSLVGPRPDVPGFADELKGQERIILSVRPGITGPATLAFRNEEELLARQDDPEAFNREVLFPAKVQLNRAYVENWRFRDDLRYLWMTATGKGTQPLQEETS